MKTYLKQYENATKNALKACGDSFDNFTKKNIGAANTKLEKLITTTEKWNTDLIALNGTISSCAEQVNTWKEKINNALQVLKPTVTQSNQLQSKIAAIGTKSASTSEKLRTLTDRTSSSTTAATKAAAAFSSMGGIISDGYKNIKDAANKAKTAAENTTKAYKEMKKAAKAAADAIDKTSTSYWPTKGATASPSKSNVEHDWYWDGYTYQYYDSGGYTGAWSDKGLDDKNGKLAVLHQKELVLNADDTKNMLSAVELVRDIMSNINSMPTLGKISPQSNFNDTIQQRVEISATFPGVTTALEIERALTELADNAYQYSNRYKY